MASRISLFFSGALLLAAAMVHAGDAAAQQQVPRCVIEGNCPAMQNVNPPMQGVAAAAHLAQQDCVNLMALYGSVMMDLSRIGGPRATQRSDPATVAALAAVAAEARAVAFQGGCPVGLFNQVLTSARQALGR